MFSLSTWVARSCSTLSVSVRWAIRAVCGPRGLTFWSMSPLACSAAREGGWGGDDEMGPMMRTRMHGVSVNIYQFSMVWKKWYRPCSVRWVSA